MVFKDITQPFLYATRACLPAGRWHVSISQKMTKTVKTYINKKSIIIGLFAILVTVVIGMSIAFATGFITPSQVFAQVIGPPCCVIPPPVIPIVPVVPVVPVVPPPVIPPIVPIIPIVPPVIPPVVVPIPVIIYGCMDSSATNYNPLATSQTGVTCTYPPATPSAPTAPTRVTVYPGACNSGTLTVSWSGATGDIWGYNIYEDGSYVDSVSGTSYTSSGLENSTTHSYYIRAYNSIESPASPSKSGTTAAACTVAPIYGCTDSGADNYNSSATADDGSCEYPAETIYGCMDSSATNYNPIATQDDGSCSYLPGPVTGCIDSTATNYNPSATADDGSCTYPVIPPVIPPVTPPTIVYGCMDSSATNYNPLATSQTGVTCTYPVVPPIVPPPGGGGGGGGGSASSGGGGSSAPKITLSMIPHVSGTQPLAYLYLSQIPYTGLELGPIGTLVYWAVLIGFAISLAYLVLFFVVPFVNRRMHNFGSSVLTLLNAQESVPNHIAPHPLPNIAERRVEIPTKQVEPKVFPAIERKLTEMSQGFSSYDGFKSFARKEALSVEDIVKGLSREHSAVVNPNIEPVYENVEPIYENVEPITVNSVKEEVKEETESLISARGFTSALIEGDREAVFAGLRQQIRGGGSPERLISSVVFLLDDAYRARIDGTTCDSNIARLTARLSTPILEEIISSLTTAIDSSYSSGVAGAKLALTRALSILGARA